MFNEITVPRDVFHVQIFPRVLSPAKPQSMRPEINGQPRGAFSVNEGRTRGAVEGI